MANHSSRVEALHSEQLAFRLLPPLILIVRSLEAGGTMASANRSEMSARARARGENWNSARNCERCEQNEMIHDRRRRRQRRDCRLFASRDAADAARDGTSGKRVAFFAISVSVGFHSEESLGIAAEHRVNGRERARTIKSVRRGWQGREEADNPRGET